MRGFSIIFRFRINSPALPLSLLAEAPFHLVDEDLPPRGVFETSGLGFEMVSLLIAPLLDLVTLPIDLARG
jgi:hypothetical protein